MLDGRRAAAIAAAVLVVPAITACSPANAAHDKGAVVSVVASTNVYGDIATRIAGKLAGTKVRITSIVDDPAIDPHSYDANTRDELAIAHADLIIENGGGYDDFVAALRSAADAKATVLDAVRISGQGAVNGSGLNEHVWYDFPTVAKLTNRIAAELGAKDPADAATFTAGAAALIRDIRALERTEAAISSAHHGAGVAITEPLPLYLLAACGLTNKTPAQFSTSVEEGSDMSAVVLQRTLQLFADRTVDVLVYNEQTSGPETERVIAAARSHGIATVPVTENLPSGRHYVAWMRDNLAALESALS